MKINQIVFCYCFQTHIHCIVRTSSPDDNANNRVLANMAKYKLFDGKDLTEEIVSERISALNGESCLVHSVILW